MSLDLLASRPTRVPPYALAKASKQATKKQRIKSQAYCSSHEARKEVLPYQPPPPLCNLFVPREKLNFGLWNTLLRTVATVSQFAPRGAFPGHLQRAPLNTTQRARGSSTPPPVCAAAGLRTYTRAAVRAVRAGPWPLPLARCARRLIDRARPGPRVRRRPPGAPSTRRSVCAFPRVIRPGERCAR